MEALSGGGVGGTAQPGLRPLTAGETLDVALKLYRRDAFGIWRTILVVLVPIWVLQIITRRLALPSDVFVQDHTLKTLTGDTQAAGAIAFGLSTVLGVIAQLLVTGALFKLLLDHYLGQPADWRRSLSFTRHRLGSLVWLAILNTILLLVALICLVVPFIWLLVAGAVAAPALMLEGLSGWRSIRRSVSLVRGRWWATLGRLLVGLLFYIGILAIVGLVSGIVGAAIETGLNVSSVTLFITINVIFSAVGTVFASPLYAAVLTVIYIDLRVRQEALDIELLASGFDTPESTIPAQGAPSPPPAPAG